jgi:hypothetical protein
MKRWLLKLRLIWRSAQNYARGLAWSPIQRCRQCDHTVYNADRRATGCRYCA